MSSFFCEHKRLGSYQAQAHAPFDGKASSSYKSFELRKCRVEMSVTQTPLFSAVQFAMRKNTHTFLGGREKKRMLLLKSRFKLLSKKKFHKTRSDLHPSAAQKFSFTTWFLHTTTPPFGRKKKERRRKKKKKTFLFELFFLSFYLLNKRRVKSADNAPPHIMLSIWSRRTHHTEAQDANY